ncbi:hypothetical protein [Lyngbya sp. PCC 8106]|uniref:hypothetical protein n=1 Tax=Lyngbya sp. (strain PCC 8106) TaxID=313612 RepID=UPI0012EADC27|nr:hypothetical protein [Lyngbya sp. PCC 8106]
MSILLTLLLVAASSIFSVVFVFWPSYGLNWLHLPQWAGLMLFGLVLSWLMGE